MVFLDESLLINTGTNRACYIHPNNQLQCLKLDLKENKETPRELKYYTRLQNNKKSFSMISKYYGKVETNLGNAYAFELIRDENKEISKEVDKYLNDYTNPIDEVETLVKLVPQFKKYLYDNKIYVKDLNTVNVMYQRINTPRLVVIDGLAHSNYNPLFYNIDSFILKKIDKSWKGFIKSLRKKEIIRENPKFLDYLL